MDKSSLELFKQAISEGLSNRFDGVVNGYSEKIVCSEKHDMAMRIIVYGKADTKRTWTPKMKRIIAILIAAALILTSCAVIFRNEIREIIEEFSVELTYSGNGGGVKSIEKVYELGYLPEGYYIESKNVSSLSAIHRLVNKKGNFIQIEQRALDGTLFVIDSESGYSQIIKIEEYDVYYRLAGKIHYYIWSNNKYSFKLTSDQELSNEEIELIIKGIK